MTSRLALPTLSNSERLARLYDPNYVYRVEAPGTGAPVQVCIDARMLDANEATGVATYAQVLRQCLPEAGATVATLDDLPDEPRGRTRRWLSAAQGAAREAIPGAEADCWQARDVFREAQVFFNIHGKLVPVSCEKPPAVMHWTYPVPMVMEGARNLYTIHDLIPLTHPELTGIDAGRHARILARIVDRAHRIVTVSETVAGHVAARLHVAPARIVNTYQAVDAPLQVDPLLPVSLQAGGFFLFCGTVEARKNLARLAQAHKAAATDLPLVVVGPCGVGEEKLEAELARSPGVIRLPWLPRNQLLGLMRRARALLYPSLAEGFGLPIAEAMTLGCPVLTSARGATAEVAGNAALLVDPDDLEALRSAIVALATNDELCVVLRRNGFERGTRYTRVPYARRLRALYASVLADEAP